MRQLTISIEIYLKDDDKSQFGCISPPILQWTFTIFIYLTTKPFNETTKVGKRETII